jgi:outer membrane protein assembly factor BamB
VLDRKSGRILWQYYGQTALKTPPRVTATLVYQWVPGKGVVAIDKMQGGYNRPAKWNVRGAIDFLSEDQTHAYLRGGDNAIMAVDKASGKILFTSKTKSYGVFANNLTDSIIYASTPDGQVAAIRPVVEAGETGEIVMRLEQAEALARLK